MGKVGSAFFDGPVLHDCSHGIGNGGVHALTVFYGLMQSLVHALGQALAHDAVVEHVAAKNIRGFGIRKVEGGRFRTIAGNGLDGVVSGGIAAHEKPLAGREGVRTKVRAQGFRAARLSQKTALRQPRRNGGYAVRTAKRPGRKTDAAGCRQRGFQDNSTVKMPRKLRRQASPTGRKRNVFTPTSTGVSLTTF